MGERQAAESAFPALKVVSEDERRIIEEYSGEDFGIKRITAITEAPLGRHFHKNKREIITVIKGSGTLLLCLVDEDGNAKGKISKHQIKEGDVIVIEPKTAHTFYLKPGTILSVFNSARFDEDDLVPARWLEEKNPK